MRTVCVVGLGYIGLPTAAMLASRGHKVFGYDINVKAVDSINQGKSHFFEPDLDMLLQAAVGTKNLRAGTDPVAADYYIIAVPTPVGREKKPDLSHVMSAVDAIAPFVKKGAAIILESTSPVGTTEKLLQRLVELRPDLRFPEYKGSSDTADVAIAYCPERILPGNMVRELVQNDRVIGGISAHCAGAVSELYKTFVVGSVMLTDCRTAEFIKLVENAYRDVNIAFANELSLICDRLDIDVWSAIDLANRHPRVSILKPGAGVGGHCIAVDPWFIVDSAPEESKLIRTARERNDSKPHWVVEQIVAKVAQLDNPTVACLGLTYKADVEDMRESPSLEIVKLLSERISGKIITCDPMIGDLPAELAGIGSIKHCPVEDAIREADVVAILVHHSDFAKIQKGRLAGKAIIDTVGLFAVGPS